MLRVKVYLGKGTGSLTEQQFQDRIKGLVQGGLKGQGKVSTGAIGQGFAELTVTAIADSKRVVAGVGRAMGKMTEAGRVEIYATDEDSGSEKRLYPPI